MELSDRKISQAFGNLSLVTEASQKVANYKLAAAIYYKNKIVAYGIASYKTSPFQKRFAANEHKIFLHAEIAAIKNSLRFLEPWQLKKSSLYVCRMRSGNKWGNSKPCPGCQIAIAEFGIKNVLYTVEDGYEIL